MGNEVDFWHTRDNKCRYVELALKCIVIISEYHLNLFSLWQILNKKYSAKTDTAIHEVLGMFWIALIV